MHGSMHWSSLELILHVVVDFCCENIYCVDIILPDYRKCDFWADFNQKLQISILLLLLKIGMKYNIKKIEGPILALQGFYKSFRHNPSLYDVPKTKTCIFPIFVKIVKKCNIKVDLKLHWGPEFSFRRFLHHTHIKLEILSI